MSVEWTNEHTWLGQKHDERTNGRTDQNEQKRDVRNTKLFSKDNETITTESWRPKST